MLRQFVKNQLVKSQLAKCRFVKNPKYVNLSKVNSSNDELVKYSNLSNGHGELDSSSKRVMECHIIKYLAYFNLT